VWSGWYTLAVFFHNHGADKDGVDSGADVVVFAVNVGF
jgi:hypothetical protein